MAAAHVVDLSFTPGEQQDLADFQFDVEILKGERVEDVQELNISHAHVLVLTSAPGAPINDILQYVTVLRAAHNEISSLRGLEAFASLEVLDLSYNDLRVVDAHAATLLKSLKRLHTVDFSHNHMNLLDLDGSFGAPSPRSNGQNGGSAGGSFGSSSSIAGAGRLLSFSSSTRDAAGGMTSLTAINLSHNAFIELPDLRSAPFLQVVNVSHNKLEDIADLEMRLPLLTLHSLLLHANRLPNVTALVPLCALAASLKHIQVFNNPFTFVNGNKAEGIDAALWWRPFLLFLCPLLITADQTELTPSERRIATKRLFREHGTLSKNSMEIMNPQNKDALVVYLKRQGESAEPPADALGTIKKIMEEEEREASMPGGAAEGAAASDQEDEDEYMPDVVVPMSRMNNEREWGVRESSGARTKGQTISYHTDPHEEVSLSTADGVANAPSTRTSTRASTRVVVLDPASHQSAGSTESILRGNYQSHRAKALPVTTVVRALQQKTRSLEEVVAVLWRSDLARRTAAAITIQRHMRGALTRLHLSEDDAESCRFIRYQLQQAAVAMKAQKPQAAAATAAGVGHSSGPSARTAAGHGARQPSIEAIEASGSNIEEVLVSMRSLEEVMSNMWVDLEEYRAMADREQRRAALLIQRWYRGYCARRDFGRVRRSSTSLSFPSCKCAGETASLQKEVAELRHEVRELRELLTQSARQQRLAAYDDPEKAMDDIVRKHEARLKADRNQEEDLHQHGGSRSPSATLSVTAADVDAPQGGGLRHSTPRGAAVGAVLKGPGQLKAPAHHTPQQPLVGNSPPGAKSPLSSTGSGSQAKRLATIAKRRPGGVTSSHTE
ncbi:putative leucine-rich repeat protein [Leptomonas pyrrhocoris]|uniref:Putative leucine-rich repeat protein n=1 Tax=Leptomonas pyrrhocoris TaxID=157538 RepID=A0A0M9G8X9_LEPPY|nr:putative leucine-rich repeat protein [Leptomonas pyrrhocoris]KPA85137.1 putative leucine-rich repeat protein [Leptomonas pyrrhocoris]|eukprot:XP_015663576.1 putative leucine-rich repeat protein [Leptomonas pyrrhocoris]